jgi:hypothetical protein
VRLGSPDSARPRTARSHAACHQTTPRRAHPDVRLHILEVDFDRHKDWVRQFRAPRQSTLILFRGTEQRWYAVAETRREAIFAALNEAAAPK